MEAESPHQSSCCSTSEHATAAAASRRQRGSGAGARRQRRSKPHKEASLFCGRAAADCALAAAQAIKRQQQQQQQRRAASDKQEATRIRRQAFAELLRLHRCCRQQAMVAEHMVFAGRLTGRRHCHGTSAGSRSLAVPGSSSGTCALCTRHPMMLSSSLPGSFLRRTWRRWPPLLPRDKARQRGGIAGGSSGVAAGGVAGSSSVAERARCARSGSHELGREPMHRMQPVRRERRQTSLCLENFCLTSLSEYSMVTTSLCLENF